MSDCHYYECSPMHGNARAMVWWMRWHPSARPGCSIVTVFGGDSFSANFHAVTDDFGNLVRVYE